MVSPTTTLNSAIDAMVIATIDDPGIFLVSQSEDLLGAGPFASAPEQIDTIQGLLWARRLGRHAPELLAEALGHPVTRRVVLIGEFVAAVAEAAAAGWVVPSSSTDGSLFATPTSPEIRSAQQALGEAGFGSMLLNDVLLDLGWSITERWVPDRRVTIDEDSHLAMKAWSRRLSLRMNAGARTLIRLEPPTNSEEGWLVIPTLVSLDDPELTAEASLALRPGSRLTEDFPGSGEDLRELVTAEWTSVAAALPELGEHPRVVEVDDDTVTTLLDAGADRDVAGLELLAPVNEFTSGELVTRAFASGQPSGLHLAELTLTVEAEVILADGTRVSVSEVELSQLEGGGTGLVNLGGRWVRIDPESAEHAADLLQRAAKKVSAAELLYAGQGIDIGDVEGWVGDALNGKPWPGITPKNPAPGFMAELRPYQRDGLGWLAWLEQVGMGGILADDMGLGKTCQVLARIYEDHEGPTLVVCPAVVVENWARETARFAPSLRVGVFHGAQRRSASALAEAHDLVITTYDLLRRDRSLREQPWHRVVLDEAQAIKNPKTKVAIAARELVAPHRLALTGTPVENHLGDLWSIMQFVEPGLLGKRSEFTETFVVTNEPDPEALLALQRITRPVLLRRSKRDPGVADDLPDKIEMRVDCALTPEQVALYDATTEALITGIADVEGIVRRGQVLAALTRLKQICAHPWLITKEGSLVGRSGKFERLCELVDEIVAEGDAAIIFTQFAQLVDPISSELSRRLGRRVVSFTGKTSLVGRQVAVDEFSGEDGPPLIVISKLAGGKGINLVRANHVIHYDHWWNPAVEDQASDRAWRIGQHRTVEVHDMICPGTLEDRIAALLARKRELASQVTGLSDLVDLDTESLRELVSLGRSELIEVGAS